MSDFDKNFNETRDAILAQQKRAGAAMLGCGGALFTGFLAALFVAYKIWGGA